MGMTDIMLDLETFGNGKQACICQIGACYFNRETGEIGETFKMNIDATTSVQTGAEIDAQTVYWWLAQSDAARQSILADPKVSLQDALLKFNEFVIKDVKIWSHATFDFVTLTESYKRLNIKPMFSYRSARDIRTLVDLSGIRVNNVPRAGTHHDALADAIHQVKYCCLALKNI